MRKKNILKRHIRDAMMLFVDVKAKRNPSDTLCVTLYISKDKITIISWDTSLVVV